MWNSSAAPHTHTNTLFAITVNACACVYVCQNKTSHRVSWREIHFRERSEAEQSAKALDHLMKTLAFTTPSFSQTFCVPRCSLSALHQCCLKTLKSFSLAQRKKNTVPPPQNSLKRTMMYKYFYN